MKIITCTDCVVNKSESTSSFTGTCLGVNLIMQITWQQWCTHSSELLKLSRLMLKGDGKQNVVTSVKKTFPITCSDSAEKRNPPKPPPKPKKQQPTLLSSKALVVKPKPLLKPKTQPSKSNRIEKRENLTKHELVVSNIFLFSWVIELGIEFV